MDQILINGPTFRIGFKLSFVSFKYKSLCSDINISSKEGQSGSMQLDVTISNIFLSKIYKFQYSDTSSTKSPINSPM